MKTGKKNVSLLGLLGALLVASLPVAAETDRSGDMFAKGGWNLTDRPAVPSDRARGADMMPEAPLTAEPDADLFDRTRPLYNYGREEMVIVRPEPAPHYPLFHRENDRD